MNTEYEQRLADDGVEYCNREFMRGYGSLFTNGVIVDRMLYVREFGFAIPNSEAIAFLKSIGKILEVGSGGGYWAYELTKAGGNVVATDAIEFKDIRSRRQHPEYGFHIQWHDVEKLNALDALAKYPDRVLMMVWPSLNEPWPAEALASYGGSQFIYVGEGYGGCCANDDFFNQIETNWVGSHTISIPQWQGINDYLTLYVRKE
jgi:hypothetical protein